ncbi:hypothetical protein, partial [Paenibacillus sp. KR2-11]
LTPPGGELRLLLLGPGSAGAGAALLEQLRSAGRTLPAGLTVYAAEADPAALREAESGLRQAGRACGLPVRFHTLPLHSTITLLPDALPAGLSAGPGTLLAYAACGLPGAASGHPPLPAEALTAVARLRPRALVLSAPDADFAGSSDVLGRFEAAWPYYEALFRWLGDRMLSSGVRAGLHARYGAGLASVLGPSASAAAFAREGVRTAEWIRRLRAAGYRPAPIPPGTGGGSTGADGLREQPHPWYYGLSYAGVNLQSVLCAIPAF